MRIGGKTQLNTWDTPFFFHVHSTVDVARICSAETSSTMSIVASKYTVITFNMSLDSSVCRFDPLCIFAHTTRKLCHSGKGTLTLDFNTLATQCCIELSRNVFTNLMHETWCPRTRWLVNQNSALWPVRGWVRPMRENIPWFPAADWQSISWPLFAGKHFARQLWSMWRSFARHSTLPPIILAPKHMLRIQHWFGQSFTSENAPRSQQGPWQTFNLYAQVWVHLRKTCLDWQMFQLHDTFFELNTRLGNHRLNEVTVVGGYNFITVTFVFNPHFLWINQYLDLTNNHLHMFLFHWLQHNKTISDSCKVNSNVVCILFMHSWPNTVRKMHMCVWVARSCHEIKQCSAWRYKLLRHGIDISYNRSCPPSRMREIVFSVIFQFCQVFMHKSFHNSAHLHLLLSSVQHFESCIHMGKVMQHFHCCAHWRAVRTHTCVYSQSSTFHDFVNHVIVSKWLGSRWEGFKRFHHEHDGTATLQHGTNLNKNRNYNQLK